MPDNILVRLGAELAGRVRAWWEASTFLGDVALAFTAVTVVNSVMMLTGMDEPKAGTFAYVHLLGRLGIIMVVVGLFYLDEFRDGLARWRRADGSRRLRPHRSTRAVVDAVLGSVARAPVESMARTFTVIVGLACVATVALADVRPAVGGPALYRNLVLLAVLLVVGMVAGRSWLRRAVATRSGPS